ncbi:MULTISPECIES: substrate-binding periplasmic protein [Pseudomonas]|uniref:Transporter substrate-binding domain-containing protein n=1 Tax=Pseudomonas quercus TaxID=2722792 RepID=A0ABX0YHR0_9PSED|nr:MULTISPECIES: transporter substrate-binding domain-containing protein [Pseudomonas]MBF7144016.1 transporter substrate-binding domain-containing protein [Pseudomonas sp. LY10J]NJP02556.1 transporter substrate-binding domain-containing protein [Pseudomonas quercus]
MFKWVASLLCGLLATGLVSAQVAKTVPASGTVAIVSDAWEDYTGADGTGLGWDLMRIIFEPAGYEVVWRIEPYLRSVGLVQRGEADAWVGSYKDEQNCLYPRWHYDTDHIYALSLARLPAPTPTSLGDYRLAWVRGYEFQRYLPSAKQYEEIHRRDGILEMLKRGRADYYIDAEQEMDYIQQQAPDPMAYKMTHLIDLPLYLGFTNSERGRELRDVFDRRMDELVANGQLRAIYKRWKMPYPFEREPTKHTEGRADRAHR